MHAARGALPRLLMPRGYASSLLARARAGSSPTRGVRAAALSTAPPSPPPPPLRYSDDYLRGVLGSVETIAVVGASADWKRPSYFAMKYLQHKGYRCVPINPKAAAAGEEILGETAYDSLDAAAEGALGGAAFDMVDVFRNADAAPAVAADAVAHGAKRRPTPAETAVHAGARVDPTTGARVTPIYQNTSFVFDDADHAASLFNLQTFGNIYGRLSNPTTAVLEERVAALEGGRGGTCTASGHAAQVVALFALMAPGDRLVASNKLYGGSITQLGKTIRKFGWACDFVDADDHAAVRAALAKDPEKTKALWVESLANPGGVVSDLEPLGAAAADAGVPFVVDNTMATPYLCRPIDWGASLVVHSTTKFLSGHGNALGGCVVDAGTFDWSATPGKFPSLAEPEPAYHGLKFHESFGDLAFTTFSHAVSLRDLGPTMAPMNAWLTAQGIETLAVRMERHVASAAAVAAFLESHPKVAWVSYAGLPSSRYRGLAAKYLPRAASYPTYAVLAKEIHGDSGVTSTNVEPGRMKTAFAVFDPKGATKTSDPAKSSIW
ncbi:cystathionine gamma-synthase, partial [Aureococcus anophagefferens]